MGFKRRVVPADKRMPESGELRACQFGKSFPHLAEFLTDDTFEGGAFRLPGTVLICSGEGRVRVWINDKAEGLTAWVSGSTVWDALCAADEAIYSADTEWRSASAQRNGKARK